MPSMSPSLLAPTSSTHDRGHLARIDRPLSLVVQVEHALRDAIAMGRFHGDRLPTEVQLAGQFGVSRETVRRACEALHRQGLLVKYRRKGTFARAPDLSLDVKVADSTLLAYLEAYHPEAQAHAGSSSSAMLHGATAAAGEQGFELVVRRAPITELAAAFRRLFHSTRLRGVVF